MDQLENHSQYYLFRAGQSEYIRLTVEELITFTFLINVTERNERAAQLIDYFVLEEPYFYLEEQDRRQFKRILDDLSKEKQILILTSNLEDAIISCDAIYRLNDSGFYQLDLRDAEEDKQNVQEQDQVNITLQKISTKRNDKVILFNPPEIDFIESSNGSILVHVDRENGSEWFRKNDINKNFNCAIKSDKWTGKCI